MKFKAIMASVIVSTMAILSGFIGVNTDTITTEAQAAAQTSATGMALLEVSTGRVLYQKNMHTRRAPASTTKILTAIAVIENCGDLSKLHKIPDSAVGVEGSSIYLERGEEMSVRDLLYGLMLQSGNDCAEALAIITSGSKEKFAELMNITAKKAGALDSNFVTPHGLDAEGHMTTAYDLAKISAYALKNEEFAKIAKTQKHSAPWQGRDYDRVITNKNRLLRSFEGCDGVKTGFTRKAGRTFVSSATRDGMQVVCAVLNCGPMFEDCARLMDSAFNEFNMVEVLIKGAKIGEVEVLEARVAKVACGVGQPYRYPLRRGEEDKISTRPITPVPLTAPIAVGDETGSVEILLDNEVIGESKLYAIESAESLTMWDRLKDIAGKWS